MLSQRNTRDSLPRRTERHAVLLPAPRMIGVGVDGAPGGGDAVVLSAMLGRATHAELMLIAVFEEPLLDGVVPAERGWTSVRDQAETMLARTRDSSTSRARITVESNSQAWRGLLRAAAAPILIAPRPRHAAAV
jgi:hypothetical protein